VPPPAGCPPGGPPSPEVTGAVCRVPSAPFAQAPGYAQPVHLCRFRVRSLRRGCFLDASGRAPNPLRGHDVSAPSPPGGPRTINLVPIGYGLRPRLRGRLTLRGLALRRNPWTSGDGASHPVDRYSCQHARFRCLQRPSRDAFAGLRNAPLPVRGARGPSNPAASVRGLSPGTSSARDGC
jgi:hypothetical protein